MEAAVDSAASDAITKQRNSPLNGPRDNTARRYQSLLFMPPLIVTLNDNLNLLLNKHFKKHVNIKELCLEFPSL